MLVLVQRDEIGDSLGAPPHFLWDVRNFLDKYYPRRWIGRGGHIAWPQRRPEFTPLDFTLRGSVKDIVHVLPMSIRISQAML
jgi:hypothetical protein